MSSVPHQTEVQNKDLRMLFFFSTEEFHKVAPLFQEVKELRYITHEIGQCSLIVPTKTVPLFKARSLKFHVLKPINETDLTLKEVNDLKKGKADLYRFRQTDLFFFVNTKLFSLCRKERANGSAKNS